MPSTGTGNTCGRFVSEHARDFGHSAIGIDDHSECPMQEAGGKRCFGPEAMHSHDVCKQVLTYLRWKTSALKNSGMPAMALMVEQVRTGVVCTRP